MDETSPSDTSEKPTERVIRLRISEVLYWKYKTACAKKKLSMPRQNVNLIRDFIIRIESTEKGDK